MTAPVYFIWKVFYECIWSMTLQWIKTQTSKASPYFSSAGTHSAFGFHSLKKCDTLSKQTVSKRKQWVQPLRIFPGCWCICKNTRRAFMSSSLTAGDERFAPPGITFAPTDLLRTDNCLHWWDEMRCASSPWPLERVDDGPLTLAFWSAWLSLTVSQRKVSPVRRFKGSGQQVQGETEAHEKTPVMSRCHWSLGLCLSLVCVPCCALSYSENPFEH